jgi:hypothetical protein
VSWPVRTRICLQCRAALSDGESCTWVRHTALNPTAHDQRERLVAAVWPPEPAGTVSEMLSEYRSKRFADWSFPDETWFERQSIQPPIEVPPEPRPGPAPGRGPVGAAEAPLWTARVRYPGRVDPGAATAPSPIAGVDCVAYGVWLVDRHAEKSPVLLRDGAALGFDVELDDGRVARVPAGSVDFAGEGESRRLRRVRENLARYLGRLDPHWSAGRRGSHLPFSQVREAVLRPGDRLILRADLHVVPDPRAAAGSAYRVAAAAVLLPLGRVVIDRE